ncbi:MAG: AAA family ATPase [Euryarchaeota archaeon]|nr:AAA family ATPase [Euryarchaeota archaeon]
MKKRKKGEKVERLHTDIPGFDELIEGGFTVGSVNVLTGAAGSGKSIWTQNMVANFIRNYKMKVLYMSFEQPEWEIIDQGFQFGWDFQAMIDEGLLKFVALDSQELFDFQQIDDIKKLIVGGGYQVVVFDSVSSVYDSPISSTQILNSADRGITPQTFMEIRRANITAFFNMIKNLVVTVICIAQKVEGKPGDTTDNVIEFKGDSLTLFDFVEVAEQIERTVRVKKMRKTNINGVTHTFEFTQNGVVVQRKEV